MSFLAAPAAGAIHTPEAPAITVSDLLVALAIYEHADTPDFAKPVPERDFSAHAIRYFKTYPEKVSLDAMRAAFTVFIWDASNQRQHPKLEDVKVVYALAFENVKNEFFQGFLDEVVWVQCRARGELT